MTERLYYHDPFLYEFDGEVTEVVPAAEINGRHGVFLDRTAFYPTSGGQIHDTGWMTSENSKLRVAEVAEAEDGRVVHYIEADKPPSPGSPIHGLIDPARRRDHMQQHSGQHVLSAAFVRLFNMQTVSFHMGDDYCSIDLDTSTLTPQQVEQTELLANQIVQENRPVDIKFVSQAEAQGMGLRKIPRADKEQLRLIDIHEFDLSACGGTHVRGTGQIGSILLRKAEKVRQGWRVEFVCGQRAVTTARRDYTTLVDSAALFSSHIWDVPEQVKKSQEEVRSMRKSAEHLLEELAELEAARLLADASPSNGRKIIAKTFADRDLGFIRMLAQKLTRSEANVVALLGAVQEQDALVFAQSKGMQFDMAALLKETLAKLGGKGGGSKDMAQGGAPKSADLAAVLSEATTRLKS